MIQVLLNQLFDNERITDSAFMIKEKKSSFLKARTRSNAIIEIRKVDVYEKEIKRTVCDHASVHRL